MTSKNAQFEVYRHGKKVQSGWLRFMDESALIASLIVAFDNEFTVTDRTSEIDLSGVLESVFYMITNDTDGDFMTVQFFQTVD